METVTPAEVAKLLQPYHNTGEIGGLVGLANLILSKVNTDLTAVTANFTEIDTWSDTLATKLNADAGVTDTDYAGVNLSD